MDKITQLETHEREELFLEAAYKMAVHPAIIEKDFWVVWILDKIFSDEALSKILMFKGGTSLSKVFNVIGRFSEDIDLILDWREVIKDDPQKDQPSKNKQVKFNQLINENAKAYIKEQLLGRIETVLHPYCKCNIDEDNPFNIKVHYPATFKDGYLRNEVLLEIGPLASWMPWNSFEVSAYVVEVFPTLFEKHSCKVNTILAKRTFWEKVTILHQETNRSKEKKLPMRYSRHYYDLAMMTALPIKDEALNDLELLKQVVEFKLKFYPASWAQFETAQPGSLKLMPSAYHIKELQKDYKAMQNMIFDKNLEFNEILNRLQSLENEINTFK
jgi:hypothetical protein